MFLPSNKFALPGKPPPKIPKPKRVHSFYKYLSNPRDQPRHWATAKKGTELNGNDTALLLRLHFPAGWVTMEIGS